GLAANVSTDWSGRAAATGDDAIDSGLFRWRRVHRLDGLYDGVVVAPDARADQQLDRGRSDDWLHFWVWFSVARQLFADARARCGLGMALSLCCQRVTVCRRRAAAARAARDGRRTKSRCQPTAVASFAHRGLAADAADVRHRCNNERRVLL